MYECSNFKNTQVFNFAKQQTYEIIINMVRAVVDQLFLSLQKQQLKLGYHDYERVIHGGRW